MDFYLFENNTRSTTFLNNLPFDHQHINVVSKFILNEPVSKFIPSDPPS